MLNKGITIKIAFLCVFIASSLLLMITWLPQKQNQVVLKVNPVLLEIPQEDESQQNDEPERDGIPDDNLTITIHWPENIRVGDRDEIELFLDVDIKRQIDLQESENNVTGNGLPGASSLFENHNVTAEARLDLPGAEMFPRGTISEAMTPGKRAKFFWRIRPEKEEVYRGTLWLYLEIKSKSGLNIERRLLLARQVEIKGVNILGVSPIVLRGIGIAGLVMSILSTILAHSLKSIGY